MDDISTPPISYTLISSVVTGMAIVLLQVPQ